MSTSTSLTFSVASGILFGASWWFLIHGDAWATLYHRGTSLKYSWWFYLAPIISTLGLVAINAISAKVIDTEDSHPDPETSKKRVVLFGLILFMFIGAGISLAVSAKCYWSNPAVTIKYPGTTLTVGTVGICLSGLLFKFFRTHDVQF